MLLHLQILNKREDKGSDEKIVDFYHRVLYMRKRETKTSHCHMGSIVQDGQVSRERIRTDSKYQEVKYLYGIK